MLRACAVAVLLGAMGAVVCAGMFVASGYETVWWWLMVAAMGVVAVAWAPIKKEANRDG